MLDPQLIVRELKYHTRDRADRGLFPPFDDKAKALLQQLFWCCGPDGIHIAVAQGYDLPEGYQLALVPVRS